jgi:predicted HTH domain antitoxin
MSLVISEDVLKTVGMNKQEMLLEVALMLYHQERLESDAAAQLAEISVDDFEETYIRRYITDDIDEPVNVRSYNIFNPQDLADMKKPLTPEQIAQRVESFEKLRKIGRVISRGIKGPTDAAEMVKEGRREL